MKNNILFVFFLTITPLIAQSNKVEIEKINDGMLLLVDGENFMINGMNWDYFPIGTNYEYSIWKQPEAIIKKALDAEMKLLKEMGVNAIRQYSGVPPKWITYIYKNYGIYTMLNHAFGRYGLTINDNWVAKTNYTNPEVKEVLISELESLAKEYKNTPGLLMYLLGNENNYGLFWEGAETEDIPTEDEKSIQSATALYKLFNDATIAIKNIDQNHPIAICNGDLQFIEIIAKECQDIDIFGTNMYRGVSFGDAFQKVKQLLNIPILFTEFGADAFNSKTKKEDQNSQSYYMVGNWKEIYENAAGLGKSENSIGGFTFQFSDGWWKYAQTRNLDTHDINASWSNGGYKKDFVKGENNMNEEWFGICAKGKTDEEGLYILSPREAYYALKEVHQLNPYNNKNSIKSINKHFSKIINSQAEVKKKDCKKGSQKTINN